MSDIALGSFTALLRALRDEAGARLCGSYARGDHDLSGHLSDLDFVVRYADREDEWGDPQERPLDVAMKIFKRLEIPWESCLVGSLGSPRDTTTLPRPVEVMDTSWVEPDPDLCEKVNVYGVVFPTYRVELS